MARAIVTNIAAITPAANGTDTEVSFVVLLYGTDMPGGRPELYTLTFTIGAADTATDIQTNWTSVIVALGPQLQPPVTIARNAVLLPAYQRGR